MARRRIRNKPVTGQVYRHFAAVTVTCTLALAMFADGENRQAQASEVAEAPPGLENTRPIEFVRERTLPAAGSFGTQEFDSGFGQPMDGSEGVVPSGGGTGFGLYTSQSGMPSDRNRYGVTNAEWAKLSEDQKKRLIARFEEAQKAARSAERAQQIDELLAASRERSGMGGAIGD